MLKNIWHRNFGVKHFSLRNIKNIKLKRKFFFKLYILITLIIFLFIGALSWIVFSNVEKLSLENEYNNNIKILGQIKYNIEYMRQVIEDMGMSIFYSNDAKSVLYAQKEGEIYELIKRMERMGSIVENNNFIHSIHLYNGSMDRFYSSYRSLYYEDSTVRRLILDMPEEKRNTFVTRDIVSNKVSEKVFSFMIYDSLDKNGRPDGAVIINVKSQWLFDNINYLNRLKNSSIDKIYLINEDGSTLSTNDANEDTNSDEYLDNKSILSYLNSSYENTWNMKNEFDVLRKTINKVDYSISYLKVDKTNWTIVKVQEYNDFYQFIKRMRMNIVVIAVIFILVAIFVSLIISGRIYKPIALLVEEVKGSLIAKQNNLTENDEISLLREIHRKSITALSIYKGQVESNSQILKKYYLRRMLVDSKGINENEWKDIEVIEEMGIDFEGSFFICLLRIDNYKEFCANYSHKDRQLYKFAIANVVNELVLKNYKNEVVDMENDCLVIIASLYERVGEDIEGDDQYSNNSSNDNINYCKDGKIQDNLSAAIFETQNFIKTHFDISFSAATSNIFNNKSNMSRYFNNAFDLSMYRFIFGHRSIIKPSMVISENKYDVTGENEHDVTGENKHKATDENQSNAVNEKSRVKSPELLLNEKKLQEFVKSGDSEGLAHYLSDIFKCFYDMKYNNIRSFILKMSNIILDTAEQINKMKFEPTNLYFDRIVQDILDCETADEVKNSILEISKNIHENRENSLEEKHTVIVEAMKSIVINNYHDTNLFLQEIAAMLKISPSYAGKIFKTITGISVTDFINEVRMDKAAKLLESRNMTVDEVMNKVGIENKSYFFRLFKKKFGDTPRGYAVKRALKEL